MAKVIEGDLFRAHGNRKYQWEQWLDGQQWELTRGTDFHNPPDQFRHIAYQCARRRGLRIIWQIVDNTIRIQAKPKE